jgi:hypothetical protein
MFFLCSHWDMPSPSCSPLATFSWTPPQTPAAPPSWRIAPQGGRSPGWARAGHPVLPALPPFLASREAALAALDALPWRAWHRLCRQVMLAVVIGMGGGWFVGRLAVFAIGV